MFRAMFFGSTPIYEDDWNRYLWDGAVITEGINPYIYSPTAIVHSGVIGNEELQQLNALSSENGDFAKRINNPLLTTIYPPVAQAAFTLAAWINPFNLDALRWIYFLSEILAMFLMVKALSLFDRSALWVWIYALNPMIIFGAFNGAHMDVLLVPFILGALILIKARPVLSAICLAGAAAIKLWPLILGPILFRGYRHKPWLYIGYGLLLGAVAFALCWPMVAHLGDSQSGLNAYSSTWQRSSFIFPYLNAWSAAISPYGDLVSRLFVAAAVALAAFWFGLISKADNLKIPLGLLVVTLTLYLLSPTGYPWYVIWFAYLLPFVPSYLSLIHISEPTRPY